MKNEMLCYLNNCHVIYSGGQQAGLWQKDRYSGKALPNSVQYPQETEVD